MVNYILLLFYCLILLGCSGGSFNSIPGNNIDTIIYGNIVFSKQYIDLSKNGSTTNTLSLINSNGIVDDIVAISSSESSIITVSHNTCKLSTQQNQCLISIKAINIGSAQIKATSIYSGHVYNIIPVQVTVSSGIVGSDGISMSEKGITQTIYNNQIYNASFIFTNNTESLLTLGKMNINIVGESIGTNLDVAPCSNKNLNAHESCIILGNIIVNKPNSTSSIDFVLRESSVESKIYNFNFDLAAIVKYPNYAPYRITNYNNPGHKLYVVVLGKDSNGIQRVVKFNDQYLGSLLPVNSSYLEGSLEVPSSALGLVLYQPNYSTLPGGIGGVMYVSLDRPIPINRGDISPAPWVLNDPSRGIVFSQYEPNVWTDNQILKAILDITDINFVGLTQGFYALDINTSNNMASGLIKKTYESLSTSEIYSQIRTYLKTSWSNSWGVESSFYLTSTNPDKWIMLFGLVNWLGADPIIYPDGFNQNIYNQYVDDLWDYYSSHAMQIDAGEISPGCILTANTISNNQMQVKPLDPSKCPVNKITESNSWVWSKFTVSDFVGGAAGANSTLYGKNKTYRSMGKYISAAQSVGFLPYCDESNFIYGPENFGKNPVNQAKYWTVKYNCLPNFAIYNDMVINQYDKYFHEYIPFNYAWAYDDALGISSAVTINAESSGFTLDIHRFE
jgi:hypothetical protein